MVYAHRPDACRRYPQFTPDFRWTLADTIDGAGLCPIIYVARWGKRATEAPEFMRGERHNVLMRLLPIVEARSRG